MASEKGQPEMSEIAEDLRGDWADATLADNKPWFWMQIRPRKVIAWLERISRAEARVAELEAENTRLRECADVMADAIQNQLDSGDSPGELTFALHEYNAFFPREEAKHGG